MTPPKIDLGKICPELAEIFTFDKIPYFCRGCIPINKRKHGIECMGHERYATPGADTKRIESIAARFLALAEEIWQLKNSLVSEDSAYKAGKEEGYKTGYDDAVAEDQNRRRL